MDAATAVGTVALWSDGQLVGEQRVAMGAGQADRLFPAIQRLLADAALSARDVEAVVCGAGPGSFTSLRIAAALAKGVAHGAGCALYAVPSLLVAAASSAVPVGRFVVHADALRGERYVLPVVRHHDGRCEVAGPLGRVGLDVLAREIPANERLAVLSSPLHDEAVLEAPTMASLPNAVGRWRDTPVSLAQWEPEYGRLAEAQVKWEERHGTPLPETPAVRA